MIRSSKFPMFAIACACALARPANVVHAADTSGTPQGIPSAPLSLDIAPTSSPASASPETNEPERPLQALLNRAGAGGPLKKAGINIFGYVEGSYSYSFTNASTGTGVYSGKRIIMDRLFDFEDNAARLNQLDLTAERVIDANSKQWDIGFRVEGIFGSDARFLHANGLDFYGNNVQNPGNTSLDLHPENQLDLYQAYIDIGVPLGNGLRVRLGKFAAFFGGDVDPTKNLFYSHSLFYTYAHPFTFTGVMLTYQFTDQIIVDGGISRGQDQSLKDNNGAIDGFARGTWFINDKTKLVGAIVTGPELTHNNSDYQTLIELTLNYDVSDQLKVALDGSYVSQANTPFGVDTNGLTVHKDIEAYDVSVYASYLINDSLSFNLRGEFFRDEEGGASGIRGTEFSGTLGFRVKPFAKDSVGQYFQLRPELRVDYATTPRFGNLDKYAQVTFGIDAIFSF